MANNTDFSKSVIESFRNIIQEIEKGASEHDVRYRFVKYFVEGALKYEPKHIKWEKKRADLTIVDENDFEVIKIETKRPTEDIDKTEHEEQAFKYEEETTKYIGLTNFLRLKVWEVSKTGRKLIFDRDFSKIITDGEKEPSSDENMQILSLNNLTKEALFEPSIYEKFNETYARIDITKEAGFKKLLERLNFIANNLLLGYTLKSFGEYKEGYAKYCAEAEKAEAALRNKSNNEMKAQIAKYRMKLESDYRKYLSFSEFEFWKYCSGKDNLSDDDVRQVFCKETIYVLLNKLLFIRICEDKGLLPRNISNGGVERLREIVYDKETRYKEVIETSFRSASGLYAHFYEIGILDWFRTGDGELDRLLNRVLWTLNQFNFAHVDRDILGNLYEKYLPSGERKKLGEFYTPVEVIDFILNSVGYTYNGDIERRDLLDPACGSGGFIVRAARNLISRYLIKFGKAEKAELRNPKNWNEIVSRLNPDEAKIILEAVNEHIYGLDINPFAVHIAEMNMLFQIIDLYQKAREKYKDCKIGRFKIYRTDSLELPRQKQVWDYGAHGAFIQEQEDIKDIKNKKFDFVVGNPPYVRKELISKAEKEKISQEYAEVYHGDNDYFVYFIYRGFNWLKKGSCLGYITSNKFTKTRYGEKIREWLQKKTIIDNYIDFGDTKIFSDAVNYPSILILSKDDAVENNTINVCIVKKEIDGSTETLKKIHSNLMNAAYSDEYMQVFHMIQKELNPKQWTFVSGNQKSLIQKIEKQGTPLSELCRIDRGIYTGLNEAFIVRKNVIDNNKLESKLLKPVLLGKDIKRYSIRHNDLFLIYTKDVEIKGYPNVGEYLKRSKAKLENRWCVVDKRMGRMWYELEKPREPELYETDKIITPDISARNNFTFDNSNFYILNTAYVIIPKEEYRAHVRYFLGFLNSLLCEWYFKQIGTYVRGGYYRYISEYLKRIPVKDPKTAEEKKIANQIIKKVDEILALAKKSADLNFDELLNGKETEKLSGISSVSFALKDGAKFESLKADGNKIFINSDDFIEIKDKKTRDFVFVCLQSMQEKLKRTKDAKALIYNLEIPKDTELLKEIGKSANFGGAEAKEKITALEAEINDAVYELYGITNAERKIIEG